jgi:hypothetical protein
MAINLSSVALSRAKHGLYIIGNAQNLSSRSPMWRTVIEELETRQELGEGIPVACNRHPETTVVISKPGELPRFAPDGTCHPVAFSSPWLNHRYKADVCFLASLASAAGINVPTRSGDSSIMSAAC